MTADDEEDKGIQQLSSVSLVVHCGLCFTDGGSTFEHDAPYPTDGINFLVVHSVHYCTDSHSSCVAPLLHRRRLRPRTPREHAGGAVRGVRGEKHGRGTHRRC